MGTDFAAFFQYANVDFLARFGGQLLEFDRSRQAGGAAADYHHVVFHRVADDLFAMFQCHDYRLVLCRIKKTET